MGGTGEQVDAGGAAGMGGNEGGPGPDAGGGPSTGGSGEMGTDPDPATPESFYTANCAVCHGATGQGVDGLGPDIAHPVRDYSTWVVRNGREATTLYPGGMMVFDETAIPEDLLEGIWDFLAEQPQPTTGEGLYNDYCAACHGADATGGQTTRPIQNETGEFQADVRGGHHPGEFEVRRDFMPSWTADELTDEEIQLMVEYVQSL
jgi:mono/diheme cytochrome c family protein